MSVTSLQSRFGSTTTKKSMQDFGELFVEALPRLFENLKIPGRSIGGGFRREPLFARIKQAVEIQNAMRDVLVHPLTQEAQSRTENAFVAFLGKNEADAGMLKFFNGWHETHKTTSLVSAKIIMRLSADALSISAENGADYGNVMAHMHEVAKDDFGLGHEGHDGMYGYMTEAFGAQGWMNSRYKVYECEQFLSFLYQTGVANHKSPMDSNEHKKSIMNAMMVSIASEIWNGCEYNFIAQYIEDKLLSFNSSMRNDVKSLRNARGYIFAHAGEVESKHGLHALAAAQIYGRTVGLNFDIDNLKEIMIDYNKRVGKAFSSMHAVLGATI